MAAHPCAAAGCRKTGVFQQPAKVLLLLALGFTGLPQAVAHDFSTLSDDELAALQERLQELAPDERKPLLDELQRRLEVEHQEVGDPADIPKGPERQPIRPSAEPGHSSGPGNDPGVRQIPRYGEPPRHYGQPPPAYGQGPSIGIGRGIPRR